MVKHTVPGISTPRFEISDLLLRQVELTLELQYRLQLHGSTYMWLFSNTVGPSYPRVSHLRIQPTTDEKQHFHVSNRSFATSNSQPRIENTIFNFQLIESADAKGLSFGEVKS